MAGWYLDFATDNADYGGYVRLAGASFWAGVVGLGDHPLVALRDDEVPRARNLDVRTEGLWASLTEETPGEHWSVGMEAFAVGYDDPVDALGDERGDRVALGLDLEWERDGDVWRVHGELLVADRRIVLDTTGAVFADPPPRLNGRLADGTALSTDDIVPVVGADGLLAGGVADDRGLRLQLAPRWHAPIKASAAPARALCRVTTADARTGVAWVA